MNGEMHLEKARSGGLPMEIPGMDCLVELALDMRWSWNHLADEVWQQLDSSLWDLTHNPWVIVQTASRDRLKKTLADPGFRKKLDDLVSLRKEETNATTWFQEHHSNSPLACVAYFSMEFMLSEALPIYSGGLGNVAGDQLKAASDLGVPVIGVGLLYQQGYFRQLINKDGKQEALYPYNDPSQLPITPLREPNGEWLRIEVKLPGFSIWLRAWQVQVGRTKLYLLDTNDAANFPAYRGITSELYGGGPELRLRQELILGIGGWRLLKALGIQPQVCHLNEGHAAFAVLERARDFIEESKQPFEIALTATRVGNLFTTHTAVPAGFDRFPPDLVERYLGDCARRLGISIRDLLALGRLNPNDPSEPFNMAYLAVRGSGAVNGVSRLHGQASRRIFSPLFPHWPENEVPVGYVTNGIHIPSWNSAAADELWKKASGEGENCWFGKMETLEEGIRRVSAKELWQLRTTSRKLLIEYARQRLARELAAGGAPPEMVDMASRLFDPNVLTLGFARRFATYKRPNLLLHDPERLSRILTNPQRPVQLIIAGKAHPADRPGQEMIEQWIHFIRRPAIRPHVMFLSDYDMLLTERLVQGVDVWLNTPRRPWEASGTSGMKVLVNGAVNLSELDGWWAEAYTPEVGWALGDGREHGEDPAWDAAEAGQLYQLLEQEVVPQFYTRDQDGIPAAWVARMRESMARLTAPFSANRTVREYTEQCYVPAASACRERVADKGALGQQVVYWRKTLEQKWPELRFGDLKIQQAGQNYNFEVEVILGDINPDTVRLELYADGGYQNPPVRQEMTRGQPLTNPGDGYIYRATVPASRTPTDYTPRIVPYFRNVSVPLEEDRILWQK
ncbi:MAG TPA: alpha-glucan family phosphorylase [Candidatus Sulfotelmatobacter sp.]|nr:alpha-glucan family phosphorylase [Candidatus Sulfotelmatobacter sp.]